MVSANHASSNSALVVFDVKQAVFSVCSFTRRLDPFVLCGVRFLAVTIINSKGQLLSREGSWKEKETSTRDDHMSSIGKMFTFF